MKILLILLVVSASNAYPVSRPWTFDELKCQIKEPWNIPAEFKENPEKKAMVDAYEEMMAALSTGKESYVQAILLTANGSKVWTEEELTHLLSVNKYVNPNLIIWLQSAYFHLMQQKRNENGTNQETVEVWVPALEISTWTENDLVSAALKDPEVKPDLLPFLRSAQKKFDEANENGVNLESVKLITPVGVIPKPKGHPILVVARPVHENMLANKEQVVAHYAKAKRP